MVFAVEPSAKKTTGLKPSSIMTFVIKSDRLVPQGIGRPVGTALLPVYITGSHNSSGIIRLGGRPPEWPCDVRNARGVKWAGSASGRM